MNKTIKVILSLVVLALIIWAGYSYTQKQEMGSDEPIKIGATFPLTGSLAFLGVDEKEGVDFAIKHINEQQNGINGRPLELVIEDNEGDAKKAVSAFNKIILEKPVAFISAVTHIISALAPLAEQNEMPLIYNSTIGNFAEENKYVFKDYNDMEQDARVMADYLLEKDIDEIYSISVLNDAYFVFLDSFKEEFLSKNGYILEGDSFTMDETDFKTILLKLKSSNIKNILFNDGYPQHVIPFVQQMEELKMVDGYRLVIPLCAFPQTIEAVGEDLNKTNAVCTWFPFDVNEITNDKVKDFINDFEKDYNKKPTFNHVYTYDQTMVLAETLRQCDNEENLTSDCIVKKLLQVKNYDGIAGSLSFDENGVSKRDTFLIQFGPNGMEVLK